MGRWYRHEILSMNDFNKKKGKRKSFMILLVLLNNITHTTSTNDFHILSVSHHQ